MSKRPELVNTMKEGGSDFDHPMAANSNGKVILTVCLSVCMCECVIASKSVHVCLPFCHQEGVGFSISFYKLIRVPPSPGVGQCFCLSICLSALVSHVLVCHKPSFLCLKYDLFNNFKYAQRRSCFL